MSTLNVSNITDGTDTVETGYVVNGSAKAWVNWNGTGTVAIRDSFSVSSITDSGTGQYDPNFSSSFDNTNYVGSGAFAWGSNGNQMIALPDTVSKGRADTLAGNAYVDHVTIGVLYVGDLA